MNPSWNRPQPGRARDLAAAWSDARVGVVGDVMLDRYLWGGVTRVSPEAPVPVVEVERESFRLGGAANVARNVHALGAHPELFGLVGDDDDAGRLRAELERAGVDPSLLQADASRPTSLKTRIVAQSQHLLRVDQESREEMSEAVESRFLDGVLSRLPHLNALILSDYGKGVITAGFLESVLAAAREHGVRVCVDPKDTHFLSYRGVAVVTPNQHEAAEVLGYKLRGEEQVNRAGRELLDRLAADAVLITRGGDGMSLFERDGRRTDLPATAQRVYDVTGAGDTVTSSYAVTLAGGGDAREAAYLANLAAGLVVQEVGTAVPDLEALMAAAELGHV